MGNYVVVESFVKGKSEVISCEDRIVITPYYSEPDSRLLGGRVDKAVYYRFTI